MPARTPFPTTRRVARLLLLLAILCSPGPRLAAQPITASWTGANGNWTNPALWSSNPNYPNNGTPPGATYNAVVSGPAGNTVAVDAPITVQQLTLANGSAEINCPLPDPGQTAQVRSHASGVSTLLCQNGQVRHCLGRTA